MTTVRQDAWSTDEDLILAEVVLRHIREGSTQLAAFEEVGEQLSRTSAACGFRWNSTIRKKYESAIALAKKQRSISKKSNKLEDSWASETDSGQEQADQAEHIGKELGSVSAAELTMEKVIVFLTDYHKNQPDPGIVEQMNQLKEENQSLKDKLNKVKEEKQTMTDDYRSLLAIMERARKLSL